MAEGWLNKLGKGKIKAYSAGTHPSTVHPLAIQAMSEVGIDISSHSSKSINEFIGKDFDYVVTVCDNAREVCPVLPGTHTTMHMPFKDPVTFVGTPEERLAQFRTTRDEIAERMKALAGLILE
jgi:arsenate reductase